MTEEQKTIILFFPYVTREKSEPLPNGKHENKLGLGDKDLRVFFVFSPMY